MKEREELAVDSILNHDSAQGALCISQNSAIVHISEQCNRTQDSHKLDNHYSCSPSRLLEAVNKSALRVFLAQGQSAFATKTLIAIDATIHK